MNLKKIFLEALILGIVIVGLTECSKHKGYTQGYKDATGACIEMER